MLLGICKEDNKSTIQKWAEKTLKIRLWPKVQKSDVQSDQKDDTPSKKESPDEGEEAKDDGSDQTIQKQLEDQTSKEELEHWKSSVSDNGFEVLVVSPFTLYSTLKGNKPDFHEAMGANEAKQLYQEFVNTMKKKYQPQRVKEGEFQAYMNVSLCNDGPVTIVVDDFV